MKKFNIIRVDITRFILTLYECPSFTWITVWNRKVTEQYKSKETCYFRFMLDGSRKLCIFTSNPKRGFITGLVKATHYMDLESTSWELTLVFIPKRKLNKYHAWSDNNFLSFKVLNTRTNLRFCATRCLHPSTTFSKYMALHESS